MLNEAKTATEICRSNQTSDQFNALERTTLENEKLLAELSEKLRPILRQTPEDGGGNMKAAPEEYLVPLADAMRNVHKSAMRSSHAIRSLLERTEI